MLSLRTLTLPRARAALLGSAAGIGIAVLAVAANAQSVAPPQVLPPAGANDAAPAPQAIAAPTALPLPQAAQQQPTAPSNPSAVVEQAQPTLTLPQAPGAQPGSVRQAITDVIRQQNGQGPVSGDGPSEAAPAAEAAPSGSDAPAASPGAPSRFASPSPGARHLQPPQARGPVAIYRFAHPYGPSRRFVSGSHGHGYGVHPAHRGAFVPSYGHGVRSFGHTGHGSPTYAYRGSSGGSRH